MAVLKNVSFLFFLLSFTSQAQNVFRGNIFDAITNKPINKVEIFDSGAKQLAITNANGYFNFTSSKTKVHILCFSYNYEIFELNLYSENKNTYSISLSPISEKLSEVAVNARRAKVFEMQRLNDVEGTAIYAGKKTEVVLVEQSMANLASNNARQIYSQVAGLNIYQNDDAGLQLNIGGRGLDPNRTSNFNTRQNGYDISADVLGYPESYYAPASEGLQQVQIIRGAASLQYGTQFGGLINFVMKKPNPSKSVEIISRNTVGSYGLYTNFTSLSGTHNKLSYYTYFNLKRGDGFRPNSSFDSKNMYSYLAYDFSAKTKISAEITYLNYLAQQAGGLDDTMFNIDPFQSNRSRNWFRVNWALYNFKFSHHFSEKTNFNFSAFGLNASRDALGFRDRRVNTDDPFELRDLIKGTYSNFGFESRFLTQYQLWNKEAVFLIGAKYYNSYNTADQGPGSVDSDANFNFQFDAFDSASNQTNTYPNENIAVFGEHILYLSPKFSITPGFRYEYIKTKANGIGRDIRVQNGFKYRDFEFINNENLTRNFILLGTGLSYKKSNSLEFYANISENYRSVTFADITIANPSFKIDPDITDESGYTADIGIRGRYKKYVSYDIGGFYLKYSNRIGFTLIEDENSNIKTFRTNVGDANMYGLESLIDINLANLWLNDNRFLWSCFLNTSFIGSEYLSSDNGTLNGNKVEFVPDVNLKTGIKFGYKNLLSSLQYTHISTQFTDATNSTISDPSGVLGTIPAYDILDFSLSYKYKRFKLETGINNVMNNFYFTRRATGYPGPGIIPSAPRNYYATLEIKF
ncbi:MAG: TonB-dependent receptor domain-containing protein [Flavicella sp.]